MNKNKLFNRFIEKVSQDLKSKFDENKGIGLLFKEKRTDLGLSLKEISTRTKIQIHYIVDIENENFSSFNKSLLENYIKSLAKEYDISNEIKHYLLDLSKLNDNLSEKNKILHQSGEDKKIYKTKKWKSSDIFFLVIFLAFLISLYSFLFEDKAFLNGSLDINHSQFISKQKNLAPTLDLNF